MNHSGLRARTISVSDPLNILSVFSPDACNGYPVFYFMQTNFAKYSG